MGEVYTATSHEGALSICERVLGTAAVASDIEFVETAYHTLTGHSVAYDEFQAEKARLTRLADEAGPDDVDMYKLGASTVEALITYGTLEQVRTSNPHRYENVLVRWPTYESLYQRFVHPNTHEDTPDNPRRALLVGGYPLSSAAFMALAEDVYKVSPGNAIVADPLISAYGRNTLANGLDLPQEWNDAMSVVQTNSLLHMVFNADLRVAEVNDASQQTVLTQLLTNMHRVLRRGAHVLMCESAPGYDWVAAGKSPDDVTPENRERVEAFAGQMRAALEQVGFQVDTIEGSRNFVDNRFLFDRARNFAAYPTTPRYPALSICAHKPD